MSRMRPPLFDPPPAEKQEPEGDKARRHEGTQERREPEPEPDYDDDQHRQPAD